MLPSPAAHECVLALIRHGATENNLARPPLIQGRGLDPPLSAAGREESARLAQRLGDVALSAVYSSPLARARETAEAIAAPRTMEVEPIEALTEADVGRWEGLSWDVVRATDPVAYERFQADPARWPYAGGENLEQVAARVVPALANLGQRHLGQSIAVVAHNVVNRAALATALGLPLSLARRLPQDNTGLNVLRVTADRLTLVTLNAIGHLG